MTAPFRCPCCGSAEVARFETRLGWDDWAEGLRCGGCGHEEIVPTRTYWPRPEEISVRLAIEERWRRGPDGAR